MADEPKPEGGEQGANNQEQLDFVSLNAGGDIEVEGGEIGDDIDVEAADENAPLVSGEKGEFLKKKGFGWLLEVEDDDCGYNPEISLIEELDINVADIFWKIKSVLFPFNLDRTRLIEPDFWGPFLIVLAYCFFLVWGQVRAISWIMLIWFCGSFIVFFLVRVMGGTFTYSQTLGVVGYSVLPLVIAVALQVPLSTEGPQGVIASVLKLFGTLWGSFSAGSLLVTDELQNKRLMLMYPIFLLQVYLISLHSGV